MSDLQTALLGLQEKLQALLKRQLALEKENHQLKGNLAEQQHLITQLQNELKNEQAALILQRRCDLHNKWIPQKKQL